MGRFKPRTNKRPPPKLSRPSPTTTASQQNPPFQSDPATLPYTDPNQALDMTSPMSPLASVDPNDPAFSQALRNWSASALANTNGNGNPNLPIDLPASLAALFEAKLTLDREKQKLMRMQKELKGYREGVAAVNTTAVVSGNGKGKEVAVAEDLGPCTCEKNGHTHSYPASAHSAEAYDDDEYYESDYECYNCDCSCHFVECDHEEGCECEHNMEDMEGDETHHHNHHDEDEDETQNHTCGHPHHHQHQHHDRHYLTEHGDVAELESEDGQPIAVPNPYLTHPQPPPPLNLQEQASQEVSNMSYAQAFEAYQDQRDSAAKGLNEISGMFKAAGWPGYGPASENGVAPQPLPRIQPDPSTPRKRLADDPERLDEAVRELFNWIKAVVWTIEQAAVVAGRRSWATQETQ